MMRVLPLTLAALVIAPLAGCWSAQGGRAVPRPAPAPEFTLDDDAWPAFDTTRLGDVRDATPNTILEPDPVKMAAIAPGDDLLDAFSEVRVLHNQLDGNGLLRVVDDPKLGQPDGLSWDALIFGFEPDAFYLTARDLPHEPDVTPVPAPPPRPVPAPAPASDDEHLAETSPKPDFVILEEGVDRVHLRDGVGLRFPKAPSVADASAPRPRGLMLRFTALFVTKYEERAIETLEQLGWCVVSIDTQSNVRPPVAGRPYPPDITFEELTHAYEPARRIYELEMSMRQPGGATTDPDAWAREKAAGARPVTGFVVTPETDLGVLADDIAERIDEVLAVNAYAAEAALDYVQASRPDLEGLPVVMLGLSAGALVAPTACARLADRIDALVLIGGGADLFDIATHSDLTDGGIRLYQADASPDPRTDVIDTARHPSRETIEALDRLVLERVRLDPYHTAPLLANIPVLVVDASFDTTVPARNGKLLRERLGQPDRVRYLGGHKGLFYFLPGEIKRVARWLDRTLPAPPRG